MWLSRDEFERFLSTSLVLYSILHKKPIDFTPRYLHCKSHVFRRQTPIINTICFSILQQCILDNESNKAISRWFIKSIIYSCYICMFTNALQVGLSFMTLWKFQHIRPHVHKAFENQDLDQSHILVSFISWF